MVYAVIFKVITRLNTHTNIYFRCFFFDTVQILMKGILDENLLKKTINKALIKQHPVTQIAFSGEAHPTGCVMVHCEAP